MLKYKKEVFLYVIVIDVFNWYQTATLQRQIL